MNRRIRFVTLLTLWLTSFLANSGRAELPAGTAVEGFKTQVATGDLAGKEIDFTVERKTGWTIYVFVQADRWDRPLARFLRELDQLLVKKEMRDVQVVAVWLTEDVEKSREYLPKAQQSLQFVQTTLAVFSGDKSGPNQWAINSAKSTTVVVTRDRTVRKFFEWDSVNETLTPEVLAEVKR